jgi:hypothetical protein
VRPLTSFCLAFTGPGFTPVPVLPGAGVHPVPAYGDDSALVSDVDSGDEPPAGCPSPPPPSSESLSESTVGSDVVGSGSSVVGSGSFVVGSGSCVLVGGSVVVSGSGGVVEVTSGLVVVVVSAGVLVVGVDVGGVDVVGTAVGVVIVGCGSAPGHPPLPGSAGGGAVVVGTAGSAGYSGGGGRFGTDGVKYGGATSTEPGAPMLVTATGCTSIEGIAFGEPGSAHRGPGSLGRTGEPSR